jgi:uncharacterized protein (TIGR03067 family)
MKLLFALTSSVAMLLGASDAKQDLAQLQGTWNVVGAEHQGKKTGVGVLDKMQVTIKDNSFMMIDDKTVPKPRIEKATLELKASTTPKSIDITPDKKGNPMLLGIYKIDGDTLKLCWDKKRGEKSAVRPTSFTTLPDSKSMMLILKRAKAGGSAKINL